MRITARLSILLGIALLLLAVGMYSKGLASPTLDVRVLEPGKNPTILVQSPSGERFLVNGGADASILRELGVALPFWQRTLKEIFLTSPVAGATGGLTDVIKRYRVETLARPDAQGSRAQESLIESASENISVHILKKGDRVELGGGAYLDVLWPPEYAERMRAADAPLVLLLSYGASSILIEPALQPHVEKWLLDANPDLPVPGLVISSSTPVGTVILGGQHITQNH